jgi:predicted transcriptional regulator
MFALKDFLMSGNSFFKKALTYLSALENKSIKSLINEGWISKEEEKRILIILEKLGLVKKKSTNWIIITDKGLNVLSYYENSTEENKVTRILKEIVKM